jgi:hypothetical protein
VKSWTRTLNRDDAHDLLGCAEPGIAFADWRTAASPRIAHLSPDRQREIFRILRNQFLTWTEDQRIAEGLFLGRYHRLPASVQIQLLDVHWALSHPISLIAIRALLIPAVESNQLDIPLADLDALVAKHVESVSSESLRKTRTVLLGALEETGALLGRGTGQHRTLQARRTRPHPMVFSYLILRELEHRGADAMMRSEAIETSEAVQATLCPEDWAAYCVSWAVERQELRAHDDEIGLPG